MGLHLFDYLVVGAYLAALAGVGVYFARRHQTSDTFLVAARRMSWLPVGLSLMAALNSGIDYLTQPSATIQYGLVLLVGTLSWVAIYPWVARVVFPFYHRLHLYSVYEYLEARFDVRVRTLAAFIFILWRLGWMATALYVPCLAIHSVTGGVIDLTTMIIALGALVTLYTMLGGIQAVIWNDVMQFFVMFGGLAATLVIVTTTVPGGVAQIWEFADTTGRTSLWVPIDNVFTQPMTVPALLFALIVGRMAQYTSDQVMVQRLQTTRTVGDARQAFMVNAAGDALWMAGLSAVGLALFGYFQFHPAPEGLSSDRMLPYFMTREFPAGAVGLVIAAILAASLSSIDSAIHACSSVLIVDGYQRLIARSAAGPQSVSVLRVATVLVGVAGTTLACNVAGIGSLLEVANKLINSFSGPLFGIFVIAMFSRRASSLAALIGGSAGALTSYAVAYHSSLGFLWPSTFGFTITVLTAAAVTSVAGSSRGEEWTWRAVMHAPPARPSAALIQR
jgi:SSS family transporter